MNMTPYERLVKSGLPIDWLTIRAGWLRIGTYRYWKLSGEDVIAFALDRVGSGTEEQDHIAALLANNDPQDWQTIGRYLEELTSGQPFNRIRALRQWRFATLKLLLETLQTTQMITMDLWEKLYDFWSYYHELPDSGAMLPKWGEHPIDMIQANKIWAETEEAALRAEIIG